MNLLRLFQRTPVKRAASGVSPRILEAKRRAFPVKCLVLEYRDDKMSVMMAYQAQGKPLEVRSSGINPLPHKHLNDPTAVLIGQFETELPALTVRTAAIGGETSNIQSIFIPLDTSLLPEGSTLQQMVLTTHSNAANLERFYEQNKATNLGRKSLIVAVDASFFKGLHKGTALWKGLDVHLVSEGRKTFPENDMVKEICGLSQKALPLPSQDAIVEVKHSKEA